MATPVYITTGGASLTWGGSPLTWGVSLGVLVRKRRRPVKKMEVGMTSYLAAAELARRVADFSQRTPDWAECIIYETKPDERWDLTLVSRRVYGTPDEFLAVMAAAGLDTVEQELTERRLVLPTREQLRELKRLAGFVNDPWARTREVAASPVTGR